MSAAANLNLTFKDISQQSTLSVSGRSRSIGGLSLGFVSEEMPVSRFGFGTECLGLWMEGLVHIPAAYRGYLKSCYRT